ncbi:hypothetical protein PGT21_018851 [Puccinia graminis f. sp. tritici]|uniref:Uncharacterized protein n=1 Tax=Puccinia graminis f. sp. tritici TaxID=56615 RepID=A0A5B0M339_PUCGR|nr:hypothetical protein PGTUg99_016613 [Puccinia graminis f. sp. tritici]KAA1094356.1 hypothetical protein PGT21_018851 [Puccinia graminis f. sp. tritici]
MFPSEPGFLVPQLSLRSRAGLPKAWAKGPHPFVTRNFGRRPLAAKLPEQAATPYQPRNSSLHKPHSPISDQLLYHQPRSHTFIELFVTHHCNSGKSTVGSAAQHSSPVPTHHLNLPPFAQQLRNNQTAPTGPNSVWSPSAIPTQTITQMTTAVHEYKRPNLPPHLPHSITLNTPLPILFTFHQRSRLVTTKLAT